MSIQSMIDAAPSGGTVSVSPGIYLEQLVIDKPLTLVGPDPAMGEASVDAAGMGSGPTLLITSSQVTVRSMTFQNGPGQGIRIGTAAFPSLEEVLVEKCTIRGHDLAGIMNINSSAVDVVDNLIENNGNVSSFERAGIILRSHGPTTVISNTVHDNGDGIYAEGSSAGLLIKNNVITNEFSSAVTLGWDEQNVTIVDNFIEGCGLDNDELKGGIVIVQSMAEIISGNTIKNCKERGIMWAWVPSVGPEPESVLISSNRISSSLHDALYLFSQGPGSFIPPDPYALKPFLNENFLTESGNAGVFVSNVFLGNPTGTANPHLECNRIEANAWGVYNQTAAVVDAMNNWWGDVSGPYHLVENPGGLGNPVSDNVQFIPWKEDPPVPEPTEADCINALKVYWSCRKHHIDEAVTDVSDLVEGKITAVKCIRVNLVDAGRPPVTVKKIPGAERVQVKYGFECTLKFKDYAGWKVLTGRPVYHREILVAPALIRERRIGATADIYLQCLRCFVSGYHRITCCIGTVILLQLVSPVQLLIPTYGFCPEPEHCLSLKNKCSGYNPVFLPDPSP